MVKGLGVAVGDGDDDDDVKVDEEVSEAALTLADTSPPTTSADTTAAATRLTRNLTPTRPASSATR